MLGIIIGVGSVIVIMSLGAGAQSLILSEIEAFGTNKISVLPGKSEEDGPPASVLGIVVTSLKHKDAKTIEKQVPHIKGIVSFANDVATVKWRSNSYSTDIKGVTEDYPEVEGLEMETGRFFRQEEINDMSKVAVLGHTVKKELFGESSALGKKIKIKNNIFKVIGSAEERGTVAFQNYDDQVLLPLKTTQKLIAGIDHINMIRIEAESEDKINEIKERTEMVLRQRHGIKDQSGANDDFSVRTSADALSIVTTITNALKYFLGAMAALSLLVGGIGIMNIMLVSVTERTREIGLRKAVGADNSDITFQFLIETAAITTIGGLIGTGGGILVSYAITLIIKNIGYDWQFSISPLSIILAIAVSTAIGLIFGIYPARKASKLQPVEALRYE